MQLTSDGTILMSIVCSITFIIAFVGFVRIEDVRSCYSSVVRAIGYLFGAILAAQVTVVAFITTIMILAINLKDSKSDYRAIYSNDLKATVSFKTDLDEREFFGGQKVKEITSRQSGILKISKDAVKVTRRVSGTEYLGDVEKGSIVEKIEYSNTLQESKMFGLTLMTNKENRLKIHLKKPASEYAKEKKDAETKKELKSLLESSN